MAPITDAAQRELALDPSRSFAVSAPAGSGKTELLTQRILTLLATVQEPEEILAITFTRKAAAEMRNRLLEAIADAANGQPSESAHLQKTRALALTALQQDRQRNWQLLDNPGRLRIQTIDGFCMQLTRRMPLLARTGAEAKVTDTPEKHYQAAVRRLLSRNGKRNETGQAISLLLGHLDNRSQRVETLLCSLLARRDQWLRHLLGNRHNPESFKDYLEHGLVSLIEETLIEAAGLLAPYAGALNDMMDFANTHIAEHKPQSPITACRELTGLPPCSATALEQWRGITELLLTKSGSWRRSLTKNEGFPTQSDHYSASACKDKKHQCLALIDELTTIPGLLELLQQIPHLPNAHYAPKQWALLGALSHLLPILAAELLLEFSEFGGVDYTQISSAAFNALGSEEAPSDLALILDYRLRHILVDEFQDTSSAQFALLSRLTEGWEAGDGRTLFIVGDAMQSCYGFRDANVGLFMAAREHGIGNVPLEALDLAVNFRSQSHIIDWINRIFAQAFPQANDIGRGAVQYTPSAAMHSGEQTGTDVAIWVCPADDDNNHRQREADKVVELVRHSRANHPGDTLAILVRNRSHLEQIVNALRLAGISWQAVDIDLLAQRPIISDLFALTRALDNPLDRIAWLALLRSPLCGLDLNDLHSLAGQQKSESRPLLLINNLRDHKLASKLSSGGQVRLRALLDVIEPALHERGRRSLRQWIEGTWLALNGPANAAGGEELRLVPAYFELLEKHDRGGQIEDLGELEKAIGRVYAKPLAEADGSLQIMTIHKAKGLEFDHVILPALDRSSPANSQELLLWEERVARHGQPQLLISPLSERGGDDDPLYNWLKREKSAKETLEATRLMYVAATRAVKRLSLLACLEAESGKTTQNMFKAPRKGSLLSTLWPVISEDRDLRKCD